MRSPLTIGTVRVPTDDTRGRLPALLMRATTNVVATCRRRHRRSVS
jgi:hypothetical protein